MPYRKDLACHRLEREQDTYEVGRRVRLYDIETNAEQAIAPTGAFEVAELIRLIGGNFGNGPLVSAVWRTSFVGTGSANTVNGELLLSTGATPNSIASVQSTNRAEFVTATFNKAHLAFEMEDFSAPNVIREFGMFDPVLPLFLGDGVFYRNNSGQMSVVRRRGGVEVEEVPLANFNGRNTFTQDNNIHTYEIVYNAGVILFFQDRRIIHTMTSLDSVAYNTVHLTLGARIANINGNTANNTLKTRGFACSRIGSQSSINDSIVLNTISSGTLKRGPAFLGSVIITQIGTGGAELRLYDSDTPAGTPTLTIDLTINSLFDLAFSKRLNFGLSYAVTGNGFEVVIDWK